VEVGADDGLTGVALMFGDTLGNGETGEGLPKVIVVFAAGETAVAGRRLEILGVGDEAAAMGCSELEELPVRTRYQSAVRATIENKKLNFIGIHRIEIASTVTISPSGKKYRSGSWLARKTSHYPRPRMCPAAKFLTRPFAKKSPHPDERGQLREFSWISAMDCRRQDSIDNFFGDFL
jgi:hypothetical protein